MAQARVPVDLLNPGQVFACLGFLEAADRLLGQAEGGFDWRDGAVRFALRADGDKNPFGVVLSFLAEAEVRQCAPLGYSEPLPKNKTKKQRSRTRDESGEEADAEAAESAVTEYSITFPSAKGDRTALPIRLVGTVNEEPRSIYVSHWADASSRWNCKLYAGNRSAARIARAMLQGDEKTEGVRALWSQSRHELEQAPFDVFKTMGGSFNFDPRGAWTPIDAGYSPNDQDHAVAASPVVEILAAVGLEHARPQKDKRRVCYGVWGDLLPPSLARAALGGASVGVPIRMFRFELGSSGKNSTVTFAQEEETST